jgi:methyltransferase
MQGLMSLAVTSSLGLYLGLLALVATERFLELRIANRNAARMLARGGLEVGAAHYPWMVLLHTSLFVICPLEVWFFDRPLIPALALGSFLLLVLTMGLRYWVIRTLGDRWTTRIFVVPGEGPVLGGPFRFLRHPNYLAVGLELLALSLVHSAWVSAIVLSMGNFLILRRRISREERALREAGGYRSGLDHLPRILPRIFQGEERKP